MVTENVWACLGTVDGDTVTIDSFVKVHNSASDPRRFWKVERGDLFIVRMDWQRIVGYLHTHPNQNVRARLSGHDYAGISDHLIVGAMATNGHIHWAWGEKQRTPEP